MISSKKELREYLKADKESLGIQRKRPKLFRDEIWRFEIALRKAEYANNCSKGYFGLINKAMTKFIFHRMSVKLGFSIPINVFGKGLSIAHYGTIVVKSKSKIGDFCRIQESVTIGATGGADKGPEIGDYCFIGSGVRVIGDIKIADKVALGANAVVVRDILENSSTWAGVPAKKISNKDSMCNLLIEV